MHQIESLLAENGYLLLDGAMGTRLMADGLTQGAPPELWNVEKPDRVRRIHQAYVDAGSRIILTNSFGGTRYRLQLHDLEERAVELNRAAAELARLVADGAPHLTLVAGSIGPTGQLLQPLGELTSAEAQEAFSEQARGLVAGGADLLWIETMSSLDEVQAAVAGARTVTDLPLAVTFSFDTAGRTMMGLTAKQAALALQDLNVTFGGANCGANLPDTEAAVREMKATAPGMAVIAKANAGIPRWEGAELVYDGTPEVMAGYARRVRRAGAQLIGGCCGSSPEHIAAMAGALAETIAEEPALPGKAAANGTQVNTPEPTAGAGRRRRRRRK